MAAKNGVEFLKAVSKFMCESRGFDAVLKNVNIALNVFSHILRQFQ